MGKALIKKTKKKRDWGPIEKDIRANLLSLREIGRKYKLSDTAIRKHEKKHNIKRDLSARVREALRTKLVRADVRNANAKDEEIVDTASNVVFDVVQCHRKDVTGCRDIVGVLKNQLNEFAQTRAELTQTIEEETANDQNAQRRTAMLKAIGLPSHAGVLRDLSVALKNLIPLERQAFGIDEGDAKQKEGVTLQVLQSVMMIMPPTLAEQIRQAVASSVGVIVQGKG